MPVDRPSRKLAVIVHADVVGSTTLVQQHETIAHERTQSVFQRFSEIIEAYGGATRELRGDALVAEYDCGSGISLGEVVIADGTVTGAGVVLAQRLEQLADAGRVVVQGSGAVNGPLPSTMPP
jgi:class 3 adenylate cyclase